MFHCLLIRRLLYSNLHLSVYVVTVFPFWFLSRLWFPAVSVFCDYVSHQQLMKIPFAPHSWQYLLLSVHFILVILSLMMWYLILIVICISKTNAVMPFHVFIAYWDVIFCKVPVQNVTLLFRLIVVSLLIYRNSFCYITCKFLDLCIAYIFSKFLACVFLPNDIFWWT